MSSMPSTAGWKVVGETSNTRYYAVEGEEHVIAGLPPPGSVDDTASARENVLFQLDYFRRTGPGVVIIFFDNLVSQDKGARGVYQTEADPSVMLGSALVGGSLLSRAMGSFFMGLSKPTVSVKMFASLDDSLVWARARIKERARIK